MKTENEILTEAVKEAEKTMQCNCDLDNWEPERDTGHSWVCRIHKHAKQNKTRRPAALPDLNYETRGH